jgi:hypothetical protein
VKFRDPDFRLPVKWTGKALPQTNLLGDMELVLSKLNVRTNGGKKKYWEAPSKYWEPVWSLRKNGETLEGWSQPEWIGEDAVGNRGKFLGIHRPVLKFIATIYPETQNTLAAPSIGSLPAVDLSALTTNIWWNRTMEAGSSSVVAMGICPPGVHVFIKGEYDTNSPSGMAATSGGSPSGWVGRSRRINPLQILEQHGHYTPNPTIYLRATDLKESERLAIRVKDSTGKFWEATPDGQGGPDGIHPFLLNLPKEVTNVVCEVVFLKPLESAFLVNTESDSHYSTDPIK